MPPPSIEQHVVRTVGVSFFAWMAYSMVQLQMSMVGIETRLAAIEQRLPPAQLAAQPKPTSGIDPRGPRRPLLHDASP